MKRIALTLASAVSLTLPFAAAPPAAPVAQSQYYFPEGTTRAGFLEALVVLNTGAAPITVNVEYQFAGGGAPMTKAYPVPAQGQTFVQVNNEVGPEKDVSMFVSSASPFSATRLMSVDKAFFSLAVLGSPAVSGETAMAGITGAGSQWDLGEGTTLPGFQEYITIQNPDPVQTAQIAVDYGLEGAPGRTTTLSVPPRSRATIDVNGADQAGPNQVGVSARVRSTNGVLFLVERPLYFNHDFGSGLIDGAHVAPGTVEGDNLFFAEGNVLDDWFQFLTLFNPSTTARTSQVTYLLEGAAPMSRSYTVPAKSRRTIQVYTDAPQQGVGRNATAAVSKGVSVRIQTPNGIVAERPMYTRASIDGVPIDDGHDAVGQRAPITCGEFAGLALSSESPSLPFITLANTNATAVHLAVDFFYNFPPRVLTRNYSVPAQSRFTADLSQNNPPIGEGSFGARVRGTTASDSFIAEAPFYAAQSAGPDGPLLGPGIATVLVPTVC